MQLRSKQLLLALARTEGEVRLLQHGKEVIRFSPATAAAFVADRLDEFYGDGSKRNIRALVFSPAPSACTPAPTIHDSGFSMGTYPMASQSTAGPRYPALSSREAGMRSL